MSSKEADVLTLIAKSTTLEGLVVSFIRGLFYTDLTTAYKDLKSDVVTMWPRTP
jgi:hypothetical protein